MIIGSILVSIGAVTSGLKKGLNSAIKAVSGFTHAMGDFLKKAALVGVAAFAAITIAGARFEDAMTRTFAILSGGYGVAEEAMAALIEQARYLGRETLYTSTQAARGMQVLALAGFNVAETLEAIGPILETAIVGNIELAEAASITASALRGYGLATADAGRVSDVLASAATGANVTVASMGESLKYILPVARAAGVEFEEAAAACALLGDAGFRGSMAGTSLRRAFAQMLSPVGRAKGIMKKLGVTFLDATGNIRPLVDIIGDLRRANISAAETLEMFGLRAGPAMAALIRMGDVELARMTQRLRDAGGTAHRVAEMFRTTIIGRTKDLIASVNELGITIFNAFKEPLRTAIFATRNWVLAIERALDKTGVLGAIVDGLEEGLAPLITKIEEATEAFVDWIENLDAERVKEFWEAFTKKIADAVIKMIEFFEKAKEGWPSFKEKIIAAKNEVIAFGKTMWETLKIIIRGGENVGEIFEQIGKIIEATFRMALTQIVNAVWTIGKILWVPLELGFTLLINKMVNSFKKAMLEMQAKIAETRLGRMMGIEPPTAAEYRAMRVGEITAAEKAGIAWEKAFADIGKAIKEGFETGVVSVKEFKNEIATAVMEISKLLALEPIADIRAETAEAQKAAAERALGLIEFGKRAPLTPAQLAAKGIVMGRQQIPITILREPIEAANELNRQVGGTNQGVDAAVSNITRILSQIAKNDGYTRKKVDELANIETIGGITGESQVDAY